MTDFGDPGGAGQPTPRRQRSEEADRLAALAAAGDERALDDLLRLIRPEVLARCGRFLPNVSDAEEACQDAMLAVVRGIQTFEGRSRFSTWLWSVVANVARDTYRRLKRLAVEQGPAELGEHPDPRRTSVIAGTRLDLLDALDQIDPRYAEPVALRDICGLEYAAIAVRLTIPEGTVRSRIHEGRRLLRQQLRR